MSVFLNDNIQLNKPYLSGKNRSKYIFCELCPVWFDPKIFDKYKTHTNILYIFLLKLTTKNYPRLIK